MSEKEKQSSPLSEQESSSQSLSTSALPSSAPEPGTPIPAIKKKRYRYAGWVRALVAVASSIMILLGAVLISGSAYLWNLLDHIQFDHTQLHTDPAFSLPEGRSSVISSESGDNGSSSSMPNTTDPINTGNSGVPAVAGLEDIPLRGNTDDVTNILLVGIDGNTYKSARSDSTIVLSINHKKKTIKLVSLMRDMQVLIPGYDFNKDGRDDEAKFNVAYNTPKGISGIDRTFRTIAANFRLDIDQYVGVNFKAFPKVVDAMGGIDILLTKKEAGQVPANGCTYTVESKDPRFVPIGNEEKVYHLDGFQTLQYARIRHIDSDFRRVQRQQKVIDILLDKALSNVLSLPGLLEKLFEEVSTSFTKDEILQYMLKAFSYASYDVITGYRLPQNGLYRAGKLRGGDTLVLTDQHESVEQLHEYLYG